MMNKSLNDANPKTLASAPTFKLGMLGGVFLPTLLTILGVIYLRVGWTVFFRPNGLFMPITSDSEDEHLQNIFDRTKSNHMGIIFYAEHQITGLGREQIINVWLREQSPDWELSLHLTNLDLALLLAYQISRNWQATINLITVISDERERANGERFLNDLITWGRMPPQTRGIVQVGSFQDYLPNAPKADLNIFGLHNVVNVAFMQATMQTTSSTCIFVRDSGYESALA